MAEDKQSGLVAGAKWLLKRLQAVGLLITRTINLILVGLVYFLAIGPLSLFFKLTGRKLLAPPASVSRGSYWVKKDQPPTELTLFSRQH